MNQQQFQEISQRYAERHNCSIELARSQVARWGSPITTSQKKKKKTPSDSVASSSSTFSSSSSSSDILAAVTAVAATAAASADFESKHPRNKDGEFSDKGDGFRNPKENKKKKADSVTISNVVDHGDNTRSFTESFDGHVIPMSHVSHSTDDRHMAIMDYMKKNNKTTVFDSPVWERGGAYGTGVIYDPEFAEPFEQAMAKYVGVRDPAGINDDDTSLFLGRDGTWYGPEPAFKDDDVRPLTTHNHLTSEAASHAGLVVKYGLNNKYVNKDNEVALHDTAIYAGKAGMLRVHQHLGLSIQAFGKLITASQRRALKDLIIETELNANDIYFEGPFGHFNEDTMTRSLAAAAGKFDESKHKRNKDGEFATKGDNGGGPGKDDKSKPGNAKDDDAKPNWASNYLDDKAKLNGALISIEQSFDSMFGEYANETDGILRKLHDTVTYSENAQNVYNELSNTSSHFLEDLPDETAEMANIIINQSLKKYYDNAEYLYRGTTPDELENMLTHDNIGDGGGNFDHVPVTPFPQSALYIGEYGGVIIQFHKKALDKHVIFQGYDVNQTGDSYEKNNPQGIDLLSEAEVRLPDETIPHKGTVKQIIFTESHSLEEQQALKDKFSSLGHIAFSKNEDFEWDETIDEVQVLGASAF